jgi:S1-C subfamily serine protease
MRISCYESSKEMIDKVPSRAEFRSGNGDTLTGHKAVFPILTRRGDGSLQFLATGFFIAKMGVFVTAKHVPLLSPTKVYENLIVIHRWNDLYITRNVDVEILAWHDTADIVVGRFPEIRHDLSGQIVYNKVVTLTRRIPPIGERTSTFAFPTTIIENEEQVQRINVNDSWYFGNVERHYPGGRDRVMLPGRCFQTSMAIHGGASGGPVFDTHGHVYAINSTSVDGGPTFVSSVLDLLEIGVPDDVGLKLTVEELAQRNFVAIAEDS